jgi:hypothetical protein
MKLAEKIQEIEPTEINEAVLVCTIRRLDLEMVNVAGQVKKPGCTCVIKLGRYLRRYTDILESMTDSEIDLELSRLIPKLWQAQPVFEVSDKVVKTYQESFAASSCMTGSCAEYMQWLEDNGIKVLRYTSATGEQARALIWETRCGETLVDRIYPNQRSVVEPITQWAFDQGWLVRSHHSIPDRKTIFHDKTGRDRGPFAVDMDESENGDYPYLDSFTTGDETSNGWRLFTDGRADIKFNETDGRHSGSNDLYTCESCGDRIDEDDTRFENDLCYCESCWEENFSICEQCDESCWTEDVQSGPNGEYYCPDCFDRLCVECECCSETIFRDDARNCDGETVCDGCFDENYATIDGEHVRIDNLIEHISRLSGVIICRKTVLIHNDLVSRWEISGNRVNDSYESYPKDNQTLARLNWK